MSCRCWKISPDLLVRKVNVEKTDEQIKNCLRKRNSKQCSGGRNEDERGEEGERKNNLQVVLIGASGAREGCRLLHSRSAFATKPPANGGFVPAFSRIVKSAIEFYFQSEIPDSQKVASTLFRSIKIKGERELPSPPARAKETYSRCL